MNSDYRQSALEVGTRSLDLPDIYYPRQLPLIYRDIMPKLHEMTRQGGVVIVPVAKELERAARIFLSYLSGKIRQKGVLVQSDAFGESRFLKAPGPEIVFWMMHNGLLFGSASARLEEWLRPGRAAVITTNAHDFSRTLFRFPSKVCTSLKVYGEKYLSDFQNEFAHELALDVKNASSGADLKTFFTRVCAIDQWSVPFPIDIAEVCCGDFQANFDQLLSDARNNDLVFKTRQGLSLTSKGPPWASKYMQSAEFDEPGFYNQLIRIIDLTNSKHRHFILALFQSWISNADQRTGNKSKNNLNRKTIAVFFQTLWLEFSEDLPLDIEIYEVLDWIQAAADLNEYVIADRLSRSALGLFGHHPHLLHHRGHMLLELASKTAVSADIVNAEKALQESVQELPGNVYVLHSKGVYESRFGRKNKALEAFLAVIKLEPWNIHARASWADLLLDAGKYDQAGDVLVQAREYFTDSICLDHMQGRLFFYLGRYDDAQKNWLTMLDKYSTNIYSLQSLGHMFRKGGKWAEAMTWLDRAFKSDPENSPVLLECALVMADLAHYLKLSGKEQPPSEITAVLNKTLLAQVLRLEGMDHYENLYQAAMTVLKQAMENDPLNLRLQIQDAFISIRCRDMDKADIVLSRLEITHPGNVHVVAARAMWHEQKAQSAHALSFYRKAAAMDRNNLELNLKLAKAVFDSNSEKEAEAILNDMSLMLRVCIIP